MEEKRPARSALTSTWQPRFVLLAAIWGMSFLFIKVGDEGLAPLQVALARMAFGTAVLVIVLVVRHDRLPRGVVIWAQLALAGILLNVAPFTLFALGEQRVSSVLAGIWNAATPLIAFPVAMVVLPGERPSRQRVTGLIAGFAGVLIVLGAWSGSSGRDLGGNLMCLSAAACYGVGFPYTRKYLSNRTEGPVAMATGQLICGTIELAIITPLFTSVPHYLPARVIASVAILGALGTGLAYILNYSIIRDAGATVASTVTYVMPIFSTVAGVAVLGERLTWNEPVGAIVIIVGAALSQGRLKRRPGPRVLAPPGTGLDFP